MRMTVRIVEENMKNYNLENMIGGSAEVNSGIYRLNKYYIRTSSRN